jgi:hypothetical protein
LELERPLFPLGLGAGDAGFELPLVGWLEVEVVLGRVDGLGKLAERVTPVPVRFSAGEGALPALIVRVGAPLDVAGAALLAGGEADEDVTGRGE